MRHAKKLLDNGAPMGSTFYVCKKKKIISFDFLLKYSHYTKVLSRCVCVCK